MYYADKIETMREIFGVEEIEATSSSLKVGNNVFPILDDVIILIDPHQYTEFVKNKLHLKAQKKKETEKFAEDIQYSFSEEWKNYNRILPDHRKEFQQYFDIIDIDKLKDLRVCDLGCGNGRWSYFLKDICREIILIDFSDAIFTARKNLSEAHNCLFFMCDLKRLPFIKDFVGFLFCLGVLHHLPTYCLDEVKNLRKYSPKLLIFLYYALDNRPLYFRYILRIITVLRLQLSRIRDLYFRKIFSVLGTLYIYLPLVYLGRLLKPLKLCIHVPLYEFYKDKSVKRIQQDVYDRFFTSIEQRVSRKEILRIKDVFSEIIISDNIPYWHFLCIK